MIKNFKIKIDFLFDKVKNKKRFELNVFHKTDKNFIWGLIVNVLTLIAQLVTFFLS